MQEINVKNKYYSSAIFLLCSVNFFIVSGCSHSQEHKVNSVSLSNLAIEIESAIANKDFRLYATSGRRVTIPSTSSAEFTEVKSACGLKYLANTGDVIKSEEQRSLRKVNIDYMIAYNKKMLLICRKNR